MFPLQAFWQQRKFRRVDLTSRFLRFSFYPVKTVPAVAGNIQTDFGVDIIRVRLYGYNGTGQLLPSDGSEPCCMSQIPSGSTSSTGLSFHLWGLA